MPASELRQHLACMAAEELLTNPPWRATATDCFEFANRLSRRGIDPPTDKLCLRAIMSVYNSTLMAMALPKTRRNVL